MLVDVPDTLDSCSCATLSGVVIRASRVNSLKSALVPATTTLLTVSSDGFLSSMPAATTGMARRFFRITPGSACSSSQVPDAFTFSLQADGSLSVSLIALYGSDGTLLGMNSDAVTLATGESRSWNIPCISPQDASCYLFIEYEGSITFFGYAPILPSEYAQRYRTGTVFKGNVPVIVSNGAGYSGERFRFRFCAPSDFLLITLRKPAPPKVP